MNLPEIRFLKTVRRLTAVLSICAIGIAWWTASAQAQTQSDIIFLQDRLNRLEGQVQALQGGVPSANVGATNAGDASIAVRLDSIEERLRTLTGLAEQNAFQLRQLEDRLRRLSEDTDYRFQELGAGTGNRSSVQPQPTTPTTPQGLNLQPLAPPSSSSATIGPSTNTLRAPTTSGPININPLAPSANLPSSSATVPGSANAGQVALGVPVDPRAEYDIAYAYILQRDFDAAEVAFTDFIAKHPNSDLTGNARYWLGESHYARGQFRPAADAFLAAYTGNKQGQKAADSLLKLGMSLQQLGQASAACSTYNELINNYPNAGNTRTRAVRARQGANC